MRHRHVTTRSSFLMKQGLHSRALSQALFPSAAHWGRGHSTPGLGGDTGAGLGECRDITGSSSPAGQCPQGWQGTPPAPLPHTARPSQPQVVPIYCPEMFCPVPKPPGWHCWPCLSLPWEQGKSCQPCVPVSPPMGTVRDVLLTPGDSQGRPAHIGVTVRDILPILG